MERWREGGWKRVLQPRHCEVVLLTGELEPVTSACVQHGDSLKKCCSEEYGRTYQPMMLSRFVSVLSGVERNCGADRVVNYSSKLLHGMTSSNC